VPTLLRAALLFASGLVWPAALAAQASADTTAGRALPIIEVPTAAAGATTLAIFISGDGGWADLDRRMSAELARHGVAVVGINARAYLGSHPTPDVLGRDVARLAYDYMARWKLDRLALVGYSRGADLVPFAATRLPADLRSRLSLVAMLGLAHAASFEFHWTDLLHDTARPTDIPILPELERLRGVRMLCVYGTREKDSLCRDADLPDLERVAREGDHHFDRDYEGIADVVVGAMR
jgi:type IV secretory pathway VirJ component